MEGPGGEGQVRRLDDSLPRSLSSSQLQKLLIKRGNTEVIGPKTEAKNGSRTKMGMRLKKKEK